jgi:hypothetical protein
MPQLEDAKKVDACLRKLSDAELAQVIANPRALAGRLRLISALLPGKQIEAVTLNLPEASNSDAGMSKQSVANSRGGRRVMPPAADR